MPVCTPEALQPIAPGRAKHAPGERGVDLESAPWRGAKIRESATPAGIGDSKGTRDPGLLRTPAIRFNASGLAHRDGSEVWRLGTSSWVLLVDYDRELETCIWPLAPLRPPP